MAIRRAFGETAAGPLSGFSGGSVHPASSHVQSTLVANATADAALAATHADNPNNEGHFDLGGTQRGYTGSAEGYLERQQSRATKASGMLAAGKVTQAQYDRFTKSQGRMRRGGTRGNQVLRNTPGDIPRP